MRAVTPHETAALKTATAALLHRVGGVEAAALVTRVEKSALSTYASPNHAHALAPVDVVADLERTAGAPLVTAQLARLAGHVLVPCAAGRDSDSRAIAKVLGECGQLAQRWAESMDDGALTDAERQWVLTELAEVQAAASAAIASLQARLAR